MRRVIDLSRWNRVYDFVKLKNAIDAVVIRMGYRGYTSGEIAWDRKFTEFVAGCMKYGVPYSVYFFPSSVNLGEAYEEAEFIFQAVKRLDLCMPIYLDSEVADAKFHKGRADQLGAQERTKLLNAILAYLKERNVPAGVYASTSWFRVQLEDEKLHCPKWVAQYAQALKYQGDVTMWQYTSRGRVDGVYGSVDLSYWYHNKTLPKVAEEVIAGHFGNDVVRKKLLMASGYDYEKVQNYVNRHFH